MNHIIDYIIDEGLKINRESAAKKFTKRKIVTTMSFTRQDKLQQELIRRSEKCTDGLLDLSDIDVSKLNDISYLFHPEFAYHYFILKSVKTIDVTGWDVSRFSDFDGVFDGLSTIKHITGLDTWDVSNAVNMNNFFHQCNELEDVGDISHWDVRKLEQCRRMFSMCHSIKEIDLSAWDPVNLIACNSMFRECTSLTKCYGAVNWNTYNIKNTRLMFAGCDKLNENTSWADQY